VPNMLLWPTAGERKQSLQRQHGIVTDRRRTLAELQVRAGHRP
jgi:hypothetical protein